MKITKIMGNPLIRLASNIVYAIACCTTGILSHSWWFIAIGGYYIVLSMVRYYLLHILRGDEAVITSLCDVCELQSEIIGHILYTHSRVVSDDGRDFPVLTFGPICVRPDLQGKGIGSALIRSTMTRAREAGFSGIVITGDPAYYHRFGFRPASDFGILYEDGSSFPELMAAELHPGSLSGVCGRIAFAPAFSKIRPEDVEAFDVQFPFKEKKRLPGQIR